MRFRSKERGTRVKGHSRRGVARGGSWGARHPPLVGLLLSKQPTIFRWQKRHDNILAVKAIVEKPTFLKFVFFVKYFRQRLLSLVKMGLQAMIIRLSPLIHEGKQRCKPYIVGDPRMVSLSVTPPLKNPGYAPVSFYFSRGQNRKSRSTSFLGLSLLWNHTETLTTQATKTKKW